MDRGADVEREAPSKSSQGHSSLSDHDNCIKSYALFVFFKSNSKNKNLYLCFFVSEAENFNSEEKRQHLCSSPKNVKPIRFPVEHTPTLSVSSALFSKCQRQCLGGFFPLLLDQKSHIRRALMLWSICTDVFPRNVAFFKFCV